MIFSVKIHIGVFVAYFTESEVLTAQNGKGQADQNEVVEWM